LTSIFCPIRVDLKLDLTITFTSIFPLPVSLTSGMTLNGRLISLVVLYFISLKKKNLLEGLMRVEIKLSSESMKFIYLEFTIWRNKTNGVIRFKFTQFNTLMELDIIDGDR
jgi:hypothetical protein